MAKKFFDVFSPQEKRSKSKTKEEIKEKKEAPENPKLTQNKKGKDLKVFRSKKSLKKAFVFCSIFIVLFVGFLVLSLFPKTKIEIWPKTEIFKFKEAVLSDSNIKQADFDGKVIPGKVFIDEKSLSQEFPASGKVLKEEKARGIIRVYNAFSSAPQALLQNTRFVSADGKLFRSIKREVIPGALQNGSKLAPSYLDIEVQAAEGGEIYNIGPSTFALPGFAGTSKYTAFYGKSFSQMQGGFKGEVEQVVQEDLDLAQKTLSEKLKKESKDSLKSKIPAEFVLLDKTLSQEITDSASSANVGAVAKSFIYTIKTKSKWLVFQKADTEGIAKRVVASTIPEGKKFQEESLTINYSADSVDIESGKMNLSFEPQVKIYSDINMEDIKNALLGKSINAAKVFLQNQAEIEKVKISSWPFWIRKIPANPERVKLNLNLDLAP